MENESNGMYTDPVATYCVTLFLCNPLLLCDCHCISSLHATHPWCCAVQQTRRRRTVSKRRTANSAWWDRFYLSVTFV